jgi:hypothetical protein
MKSTSLHSLLSAISLAVMTWVGYETVQNGKSIASLTSAMKNVEQKLGETIPRRESEVRLSQLEGDLKQLSSRLRDLELNSKLTKHP